MKSFIQDKCLLKNEFILSAGGESSYYFDIKKASLNGKFLNSFSEYVLDYLLPSNNLTPNIVGGLTLGADFLTTTLVVKSYEKKMSIEQGSIVRKESKKHGTRSRIENEVVGLVKNILVVEDVITSGKSIEQAADIFKESGYQLNALLTVIDRESGGIEYLKKKFNIPVLSIFKFSDFYL